MTTPLRVGLVGAGFMSHVHGVSALANGARVVGVVGTSLESAVRGAAAYPGATGLTSLDDLLSMQPDVVHICTPNHLHAAQARAVLAADVAVVCEKPLATTVEDAQALVEMARGRIAAVPFVYRYYAAVRAIRHDILAGGHERPWLVHGSYLQDWLASRNTSNWRVDPALGGASRAFGDIGVHWCDLMEHVTGQRISAVSGIFGNAFERTGGEQANRTEDGAVVSFRTDAGSIGSVVISQASAGRKNRLWFSFDGPERSYSFNQEQPEAYWMGAEDENRLIVRDPARQPLDDGARRRALPAGHPQGYQHCFTDLIGDVYATIQSGEPAGYPTFADGLRATTIAAAVTASAAADGAWHPVDAPAPTA